MRSADPSFRLHPRSRFDAWFSAALVLWMALLTTGLAGQTASFQEPSALGRAVARKAGAQRFLRGRTSTGSVPAAQALASARQEHQAMVQSASVQPNTTSLSAAWTPIGPGQVASPLYGNVTGRVTALALDPADATGNTLYLGTTGGGIWKSTNAAGAASAVTFTPLTDTLPVFSPGGAVLPSLSIGAMAISNGVLLAGTGDPNDATDSYYGEGILRSVDGGVTWTLAQQSLDGVSGNHSFLGLAVAGIAFSSANPSLVVAAFSESAEGDVVHAANTLNSVMGLYWSSDGGVTWQMATIQDGNQTVQTPLPIGGNGGGKAATSVVWNPVRQRFYAAVRAHGYYESIDGQTWTRLLHQPGAGLTTTACPTLGFAASSVCPIFRGVLAVQPTTGDTFALTVDLANRDQGLYQDVCALAGTACGNSTVLFGTALNAAPLEIGSGSKVIAQGDYNLALNAVASGSDTLLYAGTIDLYRCSLAAGCSLRNTTNAQNGCVNPAGVAPAQHAIASLAGAGAPLLYVGNDGGLYRSTDGANEQASACSLDDANHFQNLNAGIGSLAEVVSFAQSPTAASTLLAGLGALGTAGTGSATSAWTQLATGEGGTVAIDPANPQLWYLSTGAGVSIARCTSGSACGPGNFASSVIGAAQVGGDSAETDAPWLLDPLLTSNLIAGTCRVWRGAATGGAAWSGANAISAPFATPAASACASTAPLVRSLAAGGPGNLSAAGQSAGSEVIYAGLAGVLDGGQGLGGHLFVTTAANLASSTTAWRDAALSTVTNDFADSGLFNPQGFDVSAIVADTHDATGNTVYATLLGFSQIGASSPHVYRSVDGGLHWTNVTSNLPNAPANSIVVDPNDANTVYVALDTGVYVTTNISTCTSGNCWSVFGTSLPNAPVVSLQAAAQVTTGNGRLGELRAATYGRGIWQIPLLTATNSVLPAIALSPTTAAFGAQAVGTVSSYATITVTNSGSANLVVSSITTTGDFNEIDTCIGNQIPQGSTCSVQVRFAPASTGSRTGVLTVYGNVAGGQATATLSGTGTPAAAIVLTPTTMTFPVTSVGATSAVQNITISNTGSASAGMQKPVISGDFKISANTCGTMLSSQTGCTVSIVFAPSATGARSGSLTVVDDAGTQTASLSGTATNPATDTLSLTSLSFSSQQLSTASASQAVSIINAGDVALTLITAQVTSGDFTVVNGCGNSLNAHSTCTFSVSFVPKSLGQQSGVLTISDQFRSQTVQLGGFGIAPPGVSLAPINGLAFGNIGVGLTSAPQTVTLTNNGGVALTISSTAVTGDYSVAAGSNTCGQSLAPAGVCTLGIVFAPTAGGSRSGTLAFVDSAGSSPQTIQLTGSGADFAVAVNGASSLTVASGQAATYSLLLSSAANVTGNVTFTCTGVPAHSTCTVNPAGVALGGSTPITVTVATGLTTVRLDAPRLPWQKTLNWLAVLLPTVLLCRHKRPQRLLVLLLALALVSAGGCATGRTEPGTGSTGTSATAVSPSGSYSLVVTASSAGLTRTTLLTLVIQ